jgi:hypothetical protein
MVGDLGGDGKPSPFLIGAPDTLKSEWCSKSAPFRNNWLGLSPDFRDGMFLILPFPLYFPAIFIYCAQSDFYADEGFHGYQQDSQFFHHCPY